MTNTQRQQKRRAKEKAWLEAYGFTSWESLHTILMSESQPDKPHPIVQRFLKGEMDAGGTIAALENALRVAQIIKRKDKKS